MKQYWRVNDDHIEIIVGDDVTQEILALERIVGVIREAWAGATVNVGGERKTVAEYIDGELIAYGQINIHDAGIVSDLASMPPPLQEYEDGALECLFCVSRSDHVEQHEPTCLWRRAKEARNA